MPVWSDKGNPPGPLNYRQIDELIAFLRATNDHDLRRPRRLDERADHRSGDRQGRRRSRAGATRTTSRPPGATPVPGLLPQRADRRRRRLGARPARVGRPERPDAHGHGARAARRRPASTRRRSRPRPTRRSRSSSTTRTRRRPHNVVIKDSTATPRSRWATPRSSPAPQKKSYAVPALKAGHATRSSARSTRRR